MAALPALAAPPASADLNHAFHGWKSGALTAIHGTADIRNLHRHGFDPVAGAAGWLQAIAAALARGWELSLTVRPRGGAIANMRAAVGTVLATLLGAASPVWADGAPGAAPPPVESAARQASRLSFEAGTRRYLAGDYAGALAWFDDAYRKFPSPAFFFNLAQCHRRLGHSREAIRYFEDFLRLVPEAPDQVAIRETIAGLRAETESLARADYAEGTAHYQAGRYRPALEAFKRAYARHDSPAFLYNLAQCHRRLGENGEAKRYYAMYLRLVPDAADRPEIERTVAGLDDPPPPIGAPRRRWWPWALGAGGAVVVAGIAVGVGLAVPRGAAIPDGALAVQFP